MTIEKHYILDRNKGGPDSPFSIEPKELALLSSVTKTVWQAKGKGQYKRSTDEIKNTIFRRSIYFIKDMSVGEIVTQEHVRRIRPGFGLHPRYYDKIIGLKVLVVGEPIIDSYVYTNAQNMASKSPIISARYIKEENCSLFTHLSVKVFHFNVFVGFKPLINLVKRQ